MTMNDCDDGGTTGTTRTTGDDRNDEWMMGGDNLGGECDGYWREIGQLETNYSSNDRSLHL
jgi:hypothetical protein